MRIVVNEQQWKRPHGRYFFYIVYEITKLKYHESNFKYWDNIHTNVSTKDFLYYPAIFMLMNMCKGNKALFLFPRWFSKFCLSFQFSFCMTASVCSSLYFNFSSTSMYSCGWLELLSYQFAKKLCEKGKLADKNEPTRFCLTSQSAFMDWENFKNRLIWLSQKFSWSKVLMQNLSDRWNNTE